jgi:hypothetical protein
MFKLFSMLRFTSKFFISLETKLQEFMFVDVRVIVKMWTELKLLGCNAKASACEHGKEMFRN